MGKKKRGHPDVEEILSRPWCYYCERDFEDLKLLISHQKAKHFKCDRCGRRLNTAGGLQVHMNQVHKETLEHVENALPNRQGLEVEIFGMEGIPAEALDQHRNRIIQNFYQAQEDRRIATGNPVPGQYEGQRKKIKMESKDELLKRLAEWRRKKENGELPPAGTHAADGKAPNQVTVPETDGIEEMIRLAEQGARQQMPVAPAAAAASGGGDGEVKKKKDKGKMVYDDAEFSPEERMSMLPRYSFQAEVGA